MIRCAPRCWLVALELLVIGVILAMVLIGRRLLWHERWLDYRALAENLRHGRFLAFVSEFGRIHGTPPGGEQREPPWFLWYIRATMREIGLPNATLDGTYQWRLLNATLTHEIEGRDGQVAYHRANSANAERIDHVLHRLGVGCFVATFLILLAFLVTYGIEWMMGATPAAGTHGGCYENPLLCAKPWVTFLAAGLPALGAALAGIRVQGDFEGSRERSQTMLRGTRPAGGRIPDGGKPPDRPRRDRRTADCNGADDVGGRRRLAGAVRAQTPDLAGVSLRGRNLARLIVACMSR